jgi:hypothetical protein
VYEGTDAEEIGETLEEVRQSGADAEIMREEFGSPLEMAQALLGGEIDAAVCNKAYMEILDEVLANFSSDVRIIFGSITKLVGFRVPDIVPSAHVK